MRTWRWLAAVAAVGAVVAALRVVAGRGGSGAVITLAGGREPVLGYDGMDRDTLVAWLSDADLDRETLLDIRDYEEANRSREPVLEAVAALLD